MALGVVLHAAVIYAVDGKWVLRDSRGSSFFISVVFVIHLFRMPAFFLVSGCLSRMVLAKRSTRDYLLSRLVRLAVPAVSTALVFNSAQAYLLAQSRGVTFVEVYADPQSGWLTHLWFLVHLMIFSVVAAVTAPLLPRVWLGRLPLLGGAVVVLLPLTGFASARMGHLLGHVTPNWLDSADMIDNLLYFLFGLLYRPGADDVPLRRLAVTAAVLLVAATGLLVADPTINQRAGVGLYCMSAAQWGLTLLCFATARRWLTGRSSMARLLSDASYSVYLFHCLFVVALALALLGSPLGPGTKFVVVVTGALAASLGLHFAVVSRFRVVTLLFNGRWPRQPGGVVRCLPVQESGPRQR
jgi:glucan biosynthesis protein C